MDPSIQNTTEKQRYPPQEKLKKNELITMARNMMRHKKNSGKKMRFSDGSPERFEANKENNASLGNHMLISESPPSKATAASSTHNQGCLIVNQRKKQIIRSSPKLPPAFRSNNN